MVSNGFELLFWVVLMAIMFMLGSLVQQSKLDKANSVIGVLEHEKKKLEEYKKYSESKFDDMFLVLTRKICFLNEEIDRLHRKYGD